MIRHLLRCRRIACVLCAALVAVHPLIHGTPLDSGALDALLAQLQAFATAPVSE